MNLQLDSKAWPGDAWGCWLDRVNYRRSRGQHDFELSIPNLQMAACESKPNRVPLMGRTGSGKSTLMNLISSMDLPSDGSVNWRLPDGRRVGWDRRGLATREAKLLRGKYFGFAFQDSSLIPHLTVRDNLMYPLRLQGMAIAKSGRIAEERLDRVLVAGESTREILASFPASLSGGQRQRVALVQAMIHDPCVLFADEPTGSLDSDTRRQVMQILFDWLSDECSSRALLWVTHHDSDPSEAAVSRYLEVVADDSGEKMGKVRSRVELTASRKN